MCVCVYGGGLGLPFDTHQSATTQLTAGLILTQAIHIRLPLGPVQLWEGDAALHWLLLHRSGAGRVGGGNGEGAGAISKRSRLY